MNYHDYTKQKKEGWVKTGLSRTACHWFDFLKMCRTHQNSERLSVLGRTERHYKLYTLKEREGTTKKVY